MMHLLQHTGDHTLVILESPPSQMPKKAAAVAAADTPTLTPSSPEEVEEFVVSVLRGRQDWLEVWTERLREWLAARVLQPLVAAVASAHEPVNAVSTHRELDTGFHVVGRIRTFACAGLCEHACIQLLRLLSA